MLKGCHVARSPAEEAVHDRGHRERAAPLGTARLPAEGLTEHALPTTGRPGFQPLAVFARDPGGALVGGAHGQVNWNWLFVSLLWVSAANRHGGLGSRILGALEGAARERGCANAHLDTFSYQARPFYERHGYTVFAVLDDYPPGYQRIFLRKALAPGSGA